MGKLAAIFCALSFSAFSQVPVFRDVIKEPKASKLFTMPDYTPKVNGSAPMFGSASTNFNGLSSQDQVRMADQDIANYRLQQERSKQILAEADAEFNSDVIEYDFPKNNAPGKKSYYNAYKEIQSMIEGKVPLDLKRAVFLVEQAYDTTLRYSDFNKQIQEAINVVGLKMKKDKIPPSDNTGKIMALFQYMADTINVYSRVGEKHITTYPKTYDFEDFWGRENYKKMFVSKLLKEGNGQCHSLPLLFLILCQEIKADASLAFSPNHSFVKFKDKRGTWHNIELTNGMMASDHFMIQSGYIKAEALQSKIYLEPATKKGEIVQCLNDLAMGYTKRFGNDSFVKVCTNLALTHQSNSLTAHQINANYYYDLGQLVLNQYKARGWNRTKLEQDARAMKIINSATGATKHIDQLGYSDMPPEAYEAWLRSAQEQSVKQQHLKEVRILNGMIEKR